MLILLAAWEVLKHIRMTDFNGTSPNPNKILQEVLSEASSCCAAGEKDIRRLLV
jgi:hypothetical protein